MPNIQLISVCPDVERNHAGYRKRKLYLTCMDYFYANYENNS